MKIIEFAIQLISGIVIIIGIHKWEQVRDAKLTLILLLQIASLFTEFISKIFIAKFNTNVIPYNIYTVAETSIILLLLGSWANPSYFTKIIRSLSAAFILFWFFECIVLRNWFRGFADYSLLMGGIILLFANGIYLYRLSNSSYLPLTKNPRFWIASSFLLYFSVSTIILSTIGMVYSEGQDVARNLLNIHLYVHIFTSALLIKALLCLPKPLTSVQ